MVQGSLSSGSRDATAPLMDRNSRSGMGDKADPFSMVMMKAHEDVDHHRQQHTKKSYMSETLLHSRSVHDSNANI